MATNVFAVVGEHRREPSRLLLLGDDGHVYAYLTPQGQPTEIEPGDDWALDPRALAHLDGSAVLSLRRRFATAEA